MASRPLTPQEAEQARRDAEVIWQGEWKRRIVLLVVVYSLMELVLITFFDTSTYDTPALIFFLASISVAMFWSHRRWFAKLEADLENGQAEIVEGTPVFPSKLVMTLAPSLAYSAQVGGRKVKFGPAIERETLQEKAAKFVCLKRTGILLP